MKKFAIHNFRKLIVSILLVTFGFSLQSFIGVRIEKRHYRKGYYIHIWHNPKNKPVHTATEKVVVKQEVQQETKQEKIISPQPAAQQKQEAPTSNDDDRGRNIAPVSRSLDR
jgi:hypothetical protein